MRRRKMTARASIWIRALLFGGVVCLSWSSHLPHVHSFVRITFSSGAPLFWTETQASLNLRLGCPPDPLPNWGPCWDDVAQNALSQWNDAGSLFRFSVQQPPDTTADPCDHSDRVNTAAFQETVCGTDFGSAIAVTISRGNGSTGVLIDTDVVVDSNRTWSAYPGPQQTSVLDLRRVVLHEFGHVLGLGHPNQAGQSIPTIMNSLVSSIDDLQADDIAGVQAIYSTLRLIPSLPEWGLMLLTLSLLTVASWQLLGPPVRVSGGMTMGTLLHLAPLLLMSSVLLGQGISVLGLVLYWALVGPLSPHDGLGAIVSGLLIATMILLYRSER